MELQHFKGSPIIAIIATTWIILGTSCATSVCTCNHEGPCACSKEGNPELLRQMGYYKLTAEEYAMLNEMLHPTIKEPEPVPEVIVYNWINDPISESMNDLLPYFTVDAAGRYLPKSVSMDHTVNAFYCYFTEGADGKPNPLRLRMQYYADDPLRFYSITLNIDGRDFDYRPATTNRGKGTGRMIWEDFDQPLRQSDRDMMFALEHAEKVQMKIHGEGGMNHIKTLTTNQIRDFYRTIRLYRLKGGDLID